MTPYKTQVRSLNNILHSPFQHCKNGVAHSLTCLQHCDRGHAEDGITFIQQVCIAPLVISTLQMLATIDFYEKHTDPAGKVRKIGTYRKLPRKLVTTKLPRFQCAL